MPGHRGGATVLGSDVEILLELIDARLESREMNGDFAPRISLGHNGVKSEPFLDGTCGDLAPDTAAEPCAQKPIP
ncbi:MULTISPECIES: hypothetical protein [Rhodococcus]|uniref:hypothetical protein n=1 Tax=Rhodococcus TaxID=1827 RepID=UPI00115FD8B4|nr:MULTISPECIES: hypothetical protein [Rhodococcus]QSE82985.1 hypothetical protein JWS14_29450 [Rhodococcus koreensis]